MLWRDEQEGHILVVRNLIKHGLDDPQIVVLRQASRLSLMIYGGFWLHVDNVIAWCKENKSKLHCGCIDKKAYLLLKSPPWHVLQSWRI